MTWTYTAGSTAKDRVRLLVGDTVSTDPLLQDEEIALYVPGGSLAEPTEMLAAARLAEIIAGKVARRVDMSSGSSSASLSQQVTHFRQLARDLRRQASRSAVPHVGGVGISAKDTVEADADRVAPAFSRETGDTVEATW